MAVIPGAGRGATVGAMASAILLLLELLGPPARAQQSDEQPVTGPHGLEVLLTPYLWTAWTSIGIETQSQSTTNTLSPGATIKHLTLVPFMGEAELRNDIYGGVLDYLHVPLLAGLRTRGINFSSGSAGETIDTGTALFLYRPYADPVQHMDVGAGLRAWGFAGNVSLNEGLAPAVSVSTGDSWVDGIVALRYHRALENGFGATLYGDIGAGGADLDWQVLATLDYTVSSWFDLRAGFRGLGFDRDAKLATFDVHMYGPILAATFRFGL